MVLIDSWSSVPPHIQPPMAQVPKPILETFSDVPGIKTNSMLLDATLFGVLFAIVTIVRLHAKVACESHVASKPRLTGTNKQFHSHYERPGAAALAAPCCGCCDLAVR